MTSIDSKDHMNHLFIEMTRSGQSKGARGKVNARLRNEGYSDHEIATARSCISESLDTLFSPDENIVWFYENHFSSILEEASNPCGETLGDTADLDADSELSHESGSDVEEIKYDLSVSVARDKDRLVILSMIKKKINHLALDKLTHILSIIHMNN